MNCIFLIPWSFSSIYQSVSRVYRITPRTMAELGSLGGNLTHDTTTKQSLSTIARPPTHRRISSSFRYPSYSQFCLCKDGLSCKSQKEGSNPFSVWSRPKFLAGSSVTGFKATRIRLVASFGAGKQFPPETIRRHPTDHCAT